MHFKIASAICFKLDQSKILSSGNELTLPNVKLLCCQIQSICTQQITGTSTHAVFSHMSKHKMWKKMKNANLMSSIVFVAEKLKKNFIEKKGENASYQHFPPPPCPTMILTALSPKVIKTRSCLSS